MGRGQDSECKYGRDKRTGVCLREDPRRRRRTPAALSLSFEGLEGVGTLGGLEGPSDKPKRSRKRKTDADEQPGHHAADREEKAPRAKRLSKKAQDARAAEFWARQQSLFATPGTPLPPPPPVEDEVRAEIDRFEAARSSVLPDYYPVPMHTAYEAPSYAPPPRSLWEELPSEPPAFIPPIQTPAQINAEFDRYFQTEVDPVTGPWYTPRPGFRPGEYDEGVVYDRFERPRSADAILRETDRRQAQLRRKEAAKNQPPKPKRFTKPKERHAWGVIELHEDLEIVRHNRDGSVVVRRPVAPRPPPKPKQRRTFTGRYALLNRNKTGTQLTIIEASRYRPPAKTAEQLRLAI